ncbi:MAG: tRNA dihydrouridine synthase DusB [Paracoccus sp. (in: a-proteobacteria)]|uniref:tRNA dihydrouridine synthase DusB n=1 Tax=Paracoccus sp. TaxID=267 RepID=UPI0026DF93E4|nr:tRNA dihydrouridine synthase DusB [Paracoccus sp. (in: a-proteobacteria)]MDO5620432.1 tRNA dihydrouridine synthase DusB [Paracoccus sp. (in: a-proteobacteria)]
MSNHDPIQLDDVTLGPPVFLAPMAGITDLPFRRMVAGFGAGLVVSEMVASTEMVTPRPSTRAAVRAKAMVAGGQPVSVQIAGREAAPMAETARIVAGMGARIIDINMGCPAKKVTGGLSGAALMRDLDHALRLIEAVVAAAESEGGLPVTLKMRLGWDEDCLNAPALARRAADAGVRMLTVHGRTRAQFYKGHADWAAIRAVRDAVPGLPLVANGDVVDAASAAQARADSGADAVMVGRGAQGAPWRLAQIAHALHAAPAPEVPQGAALAALVSAHYEEILSHYGNELGARVARKHLGWYAEAADAPDLRDALVRAPDIAATHALIRRFADLPESEAA